MAIATTQGKENLAVAYGTNATYLSLHTADPGTSGTSEVSTTGSPPYARKAASWTAGSVDGAVTVTVTFDVPAGVTVTYVGAWTAVTGGTFLDKVACTSQAFAVQGTFQITATFTQS